jgi:phage terminase small subunit
VNSKELVTTDIGAQMPASLAALPTERMRKFVLARFEQDEKGNFLSKGQAALRAGYSGSSAHVLASIGQKLMRDPRIVAAYNDEFERQVRDHGLPALKALQEITSDKFHKDRAKVALALVERAAPTVQRIDAHHTLEIIDQNQLAVDHLRKLKQLGTPREGLIAEFGINGLPHFEAMLAEQEARKANIVDCDFVEISPDTSAPADEINEPTEDFEEIL